MKNKGEKVIVALSGGVDSSVTCALLLHQGYEVEAVFMKNWTPRSSAEGALICPLGSDEKDARLVASQLGIKLSVVSFEKEYRSQVVEYLFKEYKEGRTPNPDILCNSKIKFKAFLDYALKRGADYVATGHYVRNQKIKKSKNQYQLLKGLDNNKDQSYFLYQIMQEQLKRCLFPIGEYEKPEVRKLAKKFGLATAAKPDSMGICFVGEVAMKEFLQQRIKPKTGEIITIDGKKIGEHEGVWYYTIGQRRGIGVGGGMPYYVMAKDLKHNRLIVARGDSDEALFKKEMIIGEVHWISGVQPKFPLKCRAKIRYRQAEQECIITKQKVVFKEKQRAITPGQFAVFYKGEQILGGAKIIS
ncbi:MAG: tRNA 2-thiouridine(34) synthase MnmA [Candidatus Komeilibacteria bacterium]|nr:tRNA 2-thiouridine(34) synthase MnmA [Candidatus Komeilibacteria bacterium]